MQTSLHGSRLGARVRKFRVCVEKRRPLPPFPQHTLSSRSLTGPPRGRDQATQQILIDCDSSVEGTRSCQALETNYISGAQKLSFPGSCLSNFRLAILQALVRAVMLQRTPTRNSRTAVVASRSRKPIVNLGPRPQSRSPATGHRLFASAPRLPSFDDDANPSLATARNELSYWTRAIPCTPQHLQPVGRSAFVYADSATRVRGGWKFIVHRAYWCPPHFPLVMR